MLRPSSIWFLEVYWHFTLNAQNSVKGLRREVPDGGGGSATWGWAGGPLASQEQLWLTQNAQFPCRKMKNLSHDKPSDLVSMGRSFALNEATSGQAWN